MKKKPLPLPGGAFLLSYVCGFTAVAKEQEKIPAVRVCPYPGINFNLVLCKGGADFKEILSWRVLTIILMQGK